MNFFCPKCRATLVDDRGQVIACSKCNMRIDLGEVDTQSGQSTRSLTPIGLLRNHSGEKLGRFELQECLGIGGMGSVYKAHDSTANETVAIKVLFPQLGLHTELVERFHREASFLRELSHPNVVRFLEEGHAQNVHFLVMELVEGPTLEAHLGERVLPEAEATKVVEDIGNALIAAHGKGIVHRDLKPANVILAKDGAKVLDFGVAHMAAHDFTLTQSDAMIGTLNYMAPEQRLRAKTIDARADIFSLATMLYRMVTGTLPIGRYERASKLNRSINRRFDALIERALHPNPDQRHQSVGEFLRELRSLHSQRWVVPAIAVAILFGTVATGALALNAQDPPVPVKKSFTAAPLPPASAPATAPSDVFKDDPPQKTVSTPKPKPSTAPLERSTFGGGKKGKRPAKGKVDLEQLGTKQSPP